MAREAETSLPDFIAGDEPVGPHYHPKLARFVVALALILFSTMIGLILFHWMRTSPPDAYLQVSGETRQNGIVVEVIDNGASDHSSVPQTLAAGNKYTARFPLAPGEYTVKVSKGNIVQRVNVVLREGEGLIYDLSQNPMFNDLTTQPSTPLLDGAAVPRY